MPDFNFVPDSVRAMELNAEWSKDKVKEVSTQCSLTGAMEFSFGYLLSSEMATS